MAISSGLLIGSSFVLKKKGLLASQKGQAAGEGVAYLKSVGLACLIIYVQKLPLTVLPC